MNKKQVFNSFIWKFLERASSQIINLIIQIVLTRLIMPEDFGALAILIVFINIANIFIQKGFSVSIIRKKEVSDNDLNTAFIVSELTAIILYLILFFVSPFIAQVYNIPALKNGLRIIALQLLFGAFYCIQNAILIRELKLKAIFCRSLLSAVISGGIGIILAYKGFGLWALIIHSLANQIILCVVMWYSVKWRPKLEFSKTAFKDIFSFGSKILVSELLSQGSESLRTLMIGKKYSEESLSYYDRGQVYPATLMRSIYDAISSIILPYFATEQDDSKKMEKDLTKMISLSFFVTSPIFVGMAAVAEPLIKIVFTEKWLPVIPFFIAFCLYQLPCPIQSISKQVLAAVGRSDVLLNIDIVKAIITIVTLFIALRFGIFAVVISALFTVVSTTLINLYYAAKAVNGNLFTILKGIVPSLFYCAVMFIVVYFENKISIMPFGKLLIQAVTGIAVYFVLAVLFKDNNLKFIIGLVTDKLKSINKNVQ